MDYIRTPSERFQGLPDYPFEENFLELSNGMRMHFVDVGHLGAPVVLLLHGEPSWSFLYRKMIPILAQNDLRVIAPDLIGFGKSDKLLQRSDYSYAKHVEWMKEFVQALELKSISLFCQDWGGLIGLRIAVDLIDRFDTVIAANTALPAGISEMPEAFAKWREFSQKTPVFAADKIIDKGTTSTLGTEVLEAYAAPYPDDRYLAGARIFPMLVPILKNDEEAIVNKSYWEKLSAWEKPFLTLFSDSDPIMRGGEKIFQKLIPGCQGQPHKIIENAGHFLQEDKGEEIASLIVDFLNENKIIPWREGIF